MSSPPKISVITPSYNQAAYIEATILSVLDQNYPDLEYIIIDGGSTDGSVEIIKEYAPRLTYWISEKDDGMYDALDKGFKRSTGEILMWINSDDMLHPGALFNIARIFSELPRVKWITGINGYFDRLGRIGSLGSAKNFSKFDFYIYNYRFIQQEATVWRRSLWDEAGGHLDTSLKLAGDLELWIRFFRYTQLYPCEALIGGFRVRIQDQKSYEQGDIYIAEADKIIANERKRLDSKTRRTVFYLEMIELIRKALKYSILLDLWAFRRLSEMLARRIKGPQHRIRINYESCKLEIV